MHSISKFSLKLYPLPNLSLRFKTCHILKCRKFKRRNSYKLVIKEECIW